LTTEEERLIKESSLNTFPDDKSKERIEKRFFNTIQQYGGEELNNF